MCTHSTCSHNDKSKALDNCRLWFVLHFSVCVCVPLSSFKSAYCLLLTALRLWTRCCSWVSCLFVPALTLNKQIGINKATRLLVPGKGQPLSKQFLFDTACSKNSMQCWRDFNMNAFPIQTPKDKCCLWCDAWFSVGEYSQHLTQVGLSRLFIVYFLSV